MPTGKQQQSTMFYTVVTFVGLFIIATVLAVVFYLQAEKHRTKSNTLQNQIDDLASGAELQKIGAIVGTKQPRKSRIGSMVDYLDSMVSLIIGGLPDDKSAEVKVDTANRKFKDTLNSLTQKYDALEGLEPNAPTNELVSLLADQNFPAVTADFNEALKTEFPPEKIEEAWKATIDQMGPFKKQAAIRTEKQSDFDVTLITCEFEKGFLDIKVVYNEQNQITGLSLIPTPSEVIESYDKTQTKDVSVKEQSYIEIDDPNTIGLVGIIEKLKEKLGSTASIELALQEEFVKLNNRFNDAMQVTREKEITLLAEKEKYQLQVDDIKNDYNDLKIILQQTSDQQVQTLMTQLDEEKDNRKKLHQQLLKTEAELTITVERMKHTQEKLNTLVPPPDSEIAAFKPDGQIILIDDAAKIVHLNIGSDDHVYRGLTFSVYEKNTPIPKDGKGKAEIEVFNVEKNISTARIISTNPRQPIILNDAVANLIWDSDKKNVFVVAGEFDLNADGDIDDEAADKIKALIQKWGGTAADEISIDTDFLVLGNTPTVLNKPTFEQTEIDPMAMEKYEDSLLRLDAYKQIKDQAQTLSIPVFNVERFLYFIGYKTQSAKPGAF